MKEKNSKQNSKFKFKLEFFYNRNSKQNEKTVQYEIAVLSQKVTETKTKKYANNKEQRKKRQQKPLKKETKILLDNAIKNIWSNNHTQVYYNTKNAREKWLDLGSANTCSSGKSSPRFLL